MCSWAWSVPTNDVTLNDLRRWIYKLNSLDLKDSFFAPFDDLEGKFRLLSVKATKEYYKSQGILRKPTSRFNHIFDPTFVLSFQQYIHFPSCLWAYTSLLTTGALEIRPSVLRWLIPFILSACPIQIHLQDFTFSRVPFNSFIVRIPSFELTHEHLIFSSLLRNRSVPNFPLFVVIKFPWKEAKTRERGKRQRWEILSASWESGSGESRWYLITAHCPFQDFADLPLEDKDGVGVVWRWW